MPSKTQTALIQRFHARCAALEQQAGRVQRNIAFIRAVDEYGMTGVLQACFDYVTSSHSPPNEWIAARDARYCLTPTGEGLRVAHQQTGAVVGDAYMEVQQ
jgi:hypothetical protein